MSRSADLIRFISASPSPFHCVAEAARRLREAGFTEVDPGAAPETVSPGQGQYAALGGSLLAWRAGLDAPSAAGFRILGAHTDSPNLRIKQRPDTASEGYRRWGVEVYGGVILATWTDRDLGLSGKVVVAGKDGLEERLYRCDRPIARVPNLAIHLNRKVNDEGLKLDPQKHLPPVLGLGDGPSFRAWLGAELGVSEAAILGYELGLHDVVPPTLGGLDGAFVYSPRLDNQFCAYAALMALIEAPVAAATQVIALFDHEEIGSRTWRGAMGPALGQVLARLERDHALRAPGGLARAAANSWLVSADMAHGVHPNYAELHEPNHKPRLNGGPVLKGHVEHRYATDAESAALFRMACAEVGVPCQDFVIRTDLACGTTIGPISAAELGIRTVDVGSAMLSMHSIREMCGADDAEQLIAAMGWTLHQAPSPRSAGCPSPS